MTGGFSGLLKTLGFVHRVESAPQGPPLPDEPPAAPEPQPAPPASDAPSDKPRVWGGGFELPPEGLQLKSCDLWRARLDHYKVALDFERLMADRARIDIEYNKLLNEHHRYKQEWWKLDLDRWKANQQTRMQLTTEGVAYARQAIGYIILINGGGALAILTHLGGARDGATKIPATLLALPLQFFAVGLVSAALCAAGSFFSQMAFADDRNRAAIIIRLLAMFLWVAGLIFFVMASFHAAQALRAPI